MNKENLVNYVKKNKVAIIIGSIVVVGCYWFTHTNFSYHLEDRTGKYILNPEYKEFHKYEWTDLKSVYPTKLAYDPAWFKLPPEKYIPKEQPLPKNISNISDSIIRRQAYFNFLCKTEYAAYMTNDIKGKGLESLNADNEGVLDLTAYNFFPKNLKDDIHLQKITYNTNGNPFILPVYNHDFLKLNKEDIYDLYVSKIDNKISNWGKEDKFKEIMSYDGSIYEIKYDSLNKKMLPISYNIKSKSRYYTIIKYIERESLKNLGISGYEKIIYDRKEQKIVMYIKQFNIGALLSWKEEGSVSNFSWGKQSGCEFKPEYINNF